MKEKKKSILKLLCLILLSTFGLVSGQEESPKLDDTEIASVAVVANQIDIDYARIALKRSKNQDIIDFANRMIEDHNAVIKQAVDLVNKLGVDPKDNSVSQSLIKQSKDTLKKLKKVKKRDFDRTYIDNEVTYHVSVIEAINMLLIPESDNSELKELLEAVIPALEAHLEHAKMIQSKINNQ